MAIKKLSNKVIKVATDFVATWSSNIVDVVLLPSDVCDTLEVFVWASDNESETKSDLEWDHSDNELLSSKRITLLTLKCNIKKNAKDPNFFPPNWRKCSPHYSRWQPASDGVASRIELLVLLKNWKVFLQKIYLKLFSMHGKKITIHFHYQMMNWVIS